MTPDGLLPNSTLDAIAERLDRLIALFRIAHSRELDAERRRIRADKASNTILELAEAGWVPARTLRDRVVSQTRLKQAAVRARIAELAAMAALERRGGGPTTEYRSTGVI